MPVEQRHNTNNGSLPYLFSPVSNNANKAAPLVLFLHGGRDRGTDLNVLLKWGLPRFIDLSDSLYGDPKLQQWLLSLSRRNTALVV